MFKLRQKSSRRNAKRKTLQIDGAEKYTSARHARHACLAAAWRIGSDHENELKLS